MAATSVIVQHFLVSTFIFRETGRNATGILWGTGVESILRSDFLLHRFNWLFLNPAEELQWMQPARPPAPQTCVSKGGIAAKKG
jgi:hypothetical protein